MTDKVVAMLIALITRCDGLYEMILDTKGDEINMCATMQEYTDRIEAVGYKRGKDVGREEGKAIGLEEGEKRGITKERSKLRYLKAYIAIEKAIREYHCSLEKALEMTGTTMIEYLNGKRLSEI